MSEQKIREALKGLLDRYVGLVNSGDAGSWNPEKEAEVIAAREALSQREAQEPVVVLPDGSAFTTASFPLPTDHWLYAPSEYSQGAYEPSDLPRPILTHALRGQVVAAVRYAVRGATMCGKETDFDPDALVKNAVYALCGPFTDTTAPSREVPEE